MLLFSRPTSTHGVKSFELSVKPGGLDTLVAFGPGSVLNGSVMLNLEKPVWAYNISVVFKCEEGEDGRNKETSTIFQVESCIWGRPRSDGEKYQLFQGSHMYLFAIKMPNVNYPPSMHSTYIGHRINYSLQAFLDLDTDLDAPYCIETACVPVVYLPLVTTASVPGEGAERRLTFRRSDSVVEATARLVKPAYCPGDPCTVKITTTNHSDNKISHVDVSLVCSITTSTGQEERKTRHQVLHTETFYVAIPKKTRDHHSVFRFDIPDQCVPTTQIHAERYLDIAYNVVISMGSNEVAMWPFSSSGNTALQNNTISLPVTLTTVPCNFPIPANLQLPLKTFSEQPELPCFIPNNDSPLPSPCSPYFSRSGSPIPDLDAMSADDNNVTLQDSSGFLMVPTSPRPDGSPRMSSDHTLRISPSRSTPAERSAALAVQ